MQVLGAQIGSTVLTAPGMHRQLVSENLTLGLSKSRAVCEGLLPTVWSPDQQRRCGHLDAFRSAESQAPPGPTGWPMC